MKQAELILELTNPYIKEEAEGVQRASASARIIYVDGNLSESQSHFEFTAPTGPIEAEELSWYLERYHVWPTGVFENRAKNVESQLPEWGNALYRQMADSKEGQKILQKWTKSEKPRSFTVSVNPTGDLSNAAAELLSLPWELLHDSKDFLFQDENPVQIRRKIEGIQTEEIKIADLPVRILLVSPRPEGFGISYIDHRISSIPLVEAIENSGGNAELTILTPPTLQALRQELYSASEKGTPYHVVHFDGHGVYDSGQGFLLFEDPNDADKTHGRGSELVPAQKIARIMKQFRAPLFFLEACQTAKTDKDPTSSTAGTLIQNGIPAVVAMSHSVLVETARRFVIDFYKSLVTGKTVSQAVASGQRALKKDAYRFKIFGAGSLHLQDWFVPVLFQNRDVHLFKGIDQIQQPEPVANKTANLPPDPEHTFIGRSRELLALERLLSLKSWAALIGTGGEGKTTIAVEFARWLVRSQRMDRAVFVSVEHYTDARILLDAIGTQLVESYTVAKYKDEELLTEAVKPLEHAMQQHKTIVVIDNMESILPPPDYDESKKDDYANLLYDRESLGKRR